MITKQEFKKAWYPQWEPLDKHGLLLDTKFDVFDFIYNRVTKYNESYDIMITGHRGGSKSSSAVSIASLLDPHFCLDNVCFSVEEWIELVSSFKMRHGGVVILDEVGTEGSLSSRTSMSKDNRKTSDIVQMYRTDRIITIYVSVDDSRIDKRVRSLSSVAATPISKLNDKQNNGYGLASEVDIKYRYSKPTGEGKQNQRGDGSSGYMDSEVKHWRYARKGVIKSIIVPHPPIELWKGYEKKRAERLEDVKTAAVLQKRTDEKTSKRAEVNQKKVQ